MKTFKNIGEMSPYYNERTSSYEFYENGELLDIEIKFSLRTAATLAARDIKAHDIIVWDITANDITANDITADNITANDIEANNINAENISAYRIKANKIKFYAVCYAYYSFECKSIVSRRKNAKYFCLDGEVKVG